MQAARVGAHDGMTTLGGNHIFGSFWMAEENSHASFASSLVNGAKHSVQLFGLGTAEGSISRS